MHPLSRRDFLRASATTAIMLAGSPMVCGRLGLALAQEAADATLPPGREFLMLCDTPKEIINNTAETVITGPGWLKGLDVASGESFAVELPFMGHTVTQSRRQAQQVVTFEKWGKRGALVDVRDKTVLGMAEPAAGNTFLGHAAFSEDGTLLVTTEDTYNISAGALVVRSAADLKPVQTLSSYGLGPHECRSPDGGRTIMVVNQGVGTTVAPNLAWIDLASGALVHKVEFSPQVSIAYSHCDIGFDSWVCVAGKTQPRTRPASSDFITFVSPQGQVFVPDLPAEVQGRMLNVEEGMWPEALSIAFLGQSGLVAVTMPAANIVLLFDYKANTLVDVVEALIPTGVVASLDPAAGGRGMLINSKKARALLPVVMGADNKGVAGAPDHTFGGRGSHLTRMYL